MKVDLTELFGAAVTGSRDEADFERRLEDECRRRFGRESAIVLRGANSLLDRRAGEHGGSRLGAARALAEGRGRGGAEVRQAGSVSRRTYRSLDEMPPEIRAKVEEMIRTGQTRMSSETVQTWDSRDGKPPPEIVQALARHMGEDAASSVTFRVAAGDGKGKSLTVHWIVALLAALAAAAAAALYWHLKKGG